MPGRVYAACQTAENDQPSSCEITRQALSHAKSIGRGMTSTHDRDTRLRNHAHIPAYMENQRWIVDLSQLGGIGRVIQADNGNPGCSRASQFVMRQFHRAASAQGLCRRRLNAGSLQFRQRCPENVLHAAEMLDQPARSGGA